MAGYSVRLGSTFAYSKEDAMSLKKIEKSDAEWKKLLPPDVYHVTREKGTERAFTGAYHDHKKDGVYTCVCCGLPLFDSRNKFDSGTGWPSFSAPVTEEHIETVEDCSLFMRRTEVICPACGCHLGHVFSDGPRPEDGSGVAEATGQRYCINSASLQFEKR